MNKEFKLVLQKLNQESASKLLELSKKLNIPAINLILLLLRGKETFHDINNFLLDDLTPLIDNLHLMEGVKDASELLKKNIESNKTILIWGDYDVDGTMGTTILSKYLLKLKNEQYKKFKLFYYIPDRLSEGYGLNLNTLKKLHAKYNYDLLITVDSGISNNTEIKYLKDNLNVKSIVIDHHTISNNDIFNNAIVINHRISNDKFYEKFETPFCGAGLAYAFIHYFNKVNNFYSFQELSPYSIYAALATIADVVPLVNFNRTLVRYAFNFLNDDSYLLKHIPHLYEMKKELLIYSITSDEIAFKIAPVLNAVGRLSKADQIVDFFLNNNATEITKKVKYFITLNNERKNIERDILNKIHQSLDENKIKQDKRIIVVGNDWHKGIIGIVAGKLSSHYMVPTIILSRDKNNECVASCRSIEGFDLYKALYACKGHLKRFGGHEQAAGLTIDYNNLLGFIKDFTQLTQKIPMQLSIQKEFQTDILLNPNVFADPENIINLFMLEPFGSYFPKPMFGASAVLKKITPIGTSGNHYTLEFENINIKANIFNCYEDLNQYLNKSIAFTYYPQLDTFTYKRELQQNANAELSGYIIIENIFDEGMYYEKIIDVKNILDKLELISKNENKEYLLNIV
jgi:single-stranded-DNA-specific exonuclease